MAKQPKMLDASGVENERKALQLLCEEMQNAKDADTRDALMEQIQATAAALEKLCEKLQAEADEIAPPETDEVNLNAVVEVILTPDQRRRVLEITGIDVPSVRIPDPTAELTRNMQFIKPDFVEECAIEQAENFKRLVADFEEAQDEEDA